jgi:hypothetical protein
VTDVSGDVIWTYNPTGLPAGDIPNPIKLLPNGDFLINFSGAGLDGVNSVLQEVDRARIQRFSVPQLDYLDYRRSINLLNKILNKIHRCFNASHVLVFSSLPPPWFQGARLESLLNRISSQRSDYATQVRLCAGDPAAFNPICS